MHYNSMFVKSMVYTAKDEGILILYTLLDFYSHFIYFVLFDDYQLSIHACRSMNRRLVHPLLSDVDLREQCR